MLGVTYTECTSSLLVADRGDNSLKQMRKDTLSMPRCDTGSTACPDSSLRELCICLPALKCFFRTPCQKRAEGGQRRHISLSNRKALESKTNQTCSKLHGLFQMSFVVSCSPLVYLSSLGAELLLSGKKGIGDER